MKDSRSGRLAARPWTVVVSVVLLGIYSLGFIVWGTAGIIHDQMHPENVKYGIETMLGLILVSVGVPLLICGILVLRRVRWIRVVSVGVLAALEVGISLMIGFDAQSFLFVLIGLAVPIIAVALLFLPKSTPYFSRA